jgi:hypothetical protein
MNKRFQVFVSSTFEDLKEERQAAVEAILKAGHIPAGMELFTAGSESQLDVIREWINDSDIYMLILGARYGSIEPKSKRSYTEVEFEYAREIGKPFFSVVLTDEGKETRVRERGTAVIEQENVQKFRAFRDVVCAHECAFFSTPKDIKLAVFETLPKLTLKDGLTGWVKASEVGPSNELATELARTLEENRTLKSEIERLQRKLNSAAEGNAPTFEDLYRTLSADFISYPAKFSASERDKKYSLLVLTLTYADDLARGVSNAYGVKPIESYLFYDVASPLASFGLAEHDRVPSGMMWQRFKLSKEGVRFLTWARIQKNSISNGTAADTVADASTSGANKSRPKPQSSGNPTKRTPTRPKKK